MIIYAKKRVCFYLRNYVVFFELKMSKNVMVKGSPLTSVPAIEKQMANSRITRKSLTTVTPMAI